jgi:hypothetical protein
MESPFAKETFKAWFEANEPTLARFVHSKDIAAKSGRASWVSIHTPSHTVAISAWDHENKLEVIMIDTATDESKVEDKAYASRDKLQARLDALLNQLHSMCE